MSGRLPNDCFALPPGVDWTPVDDALALLRERLVPVCEPEVCALADAVGRILAAPAVATRDNPPAANAAVDGYAFAFAPAAADATPNAAGHREARLALAGGRAAAGAPWGGTLAPGQAVRTLTGAELPDGADTVAMQEDCEVEAGGSGQLRIMLPRRTGANVRAAGEDARAGEDVLAPRRRLAPQDLARAAAAGLGQLSVHRRLRVAVLSTGDELIPPGSAPGRPGIVDANRPMLLGFAGRQGFARVDLGAAADRAAAVRAALDRGAAEADAILTTGGASAGDEDHISRLLREEGQVTTWRIAVKPGRPLILGLWRGIPVFGLPGNPVAAFVCALIFARPALIRLAGGDWETVRGHDLPAAFAKRKKAGRREYLRARLDQGGRVEVFHSEGSGLIGGLSWADGLCELPDGAVEVRPGDAVRYLPFSAFGV